MVGSYSRSAPTSEISFRKRPSQAQMDHLKQILGVEVIEGDPKWFVRDPEEYDDPDEDLRYLPSPGNARIRSDSKRRKR